ncbi:DJ-1/PfpI family protein [Massilia sp. PAMC28688]|uniref:DJ-1/PfpI family protein n=1 Tax=Massilia sp. PAMC28688 TaxID=2861283 RepID=UPI001C6278FF|nr:DJ-1/PfpI family protein [Massilia sp. PAMC28688]QYF94141.1 DJ-1/PfpI family protein [Massilia sp. PAMC28688]
MQLSIVLFDGFTALDVVGGYEVLRNVPGVQVQFVAAASGIVASDSGALGMMAASAFAQAAPADILYVPGGPGVPGALDDAALLDYVARSAARAAWMFGVCNGVEILGAAGLLKGRSVTTNMFSRNAVAAYGATVLRERYVRDGQLVTGAGVSSSIDAALYLAGLIAGDTVARTIQLGIEYYPAPPHGNGCPDEQPLPIRAIVGMIEKTREKRLAARHIPYPHVTSGAGSKPATPDT